MLGFSVAVAAATELITTTKAMVRVSKNFIFIFYLLFLFFSKIFTIFADA
jgi:hypothetical protein